MWWQLLLLQVCFFLVLIWALQRLFHGHLSSGIRRIENLHAQNLKKEEELKRMQETMAHRAEARMKELDAELASRRAAAESELRAFRETGKASLEQEKSELTAEMHHKEKVLLERLEREAFARAVEQAKRIVLEAFGPKMLEKLHAELSDELLESLSAVTEPVDLDGKPVRIASAFPLSPKQKAALLEHVGRLSRRAAGTVEARETTDPAIGAGFIVTLGGTVWDGSLRNKLERTSKER